MQGGASLALLTVSPPAQICPGQCPPHSSGSQPGALVWGCLSRMWGGCAFGAVGCTPRAPAGLRTADHTPHPWLLSELPRRSTPAQLCWAPPSVWSLQSLFPPFACPSSCLREDFALLTTGAPQAPFWWQRTVLQLMAFAWSQASFLSRMLEAEPHLSKCRARWTYWSLPGGPKR